MGSLLLLMLLLSLSLAFSFPFLHKSDEKRFSPQLFETLYRNPNSPYAIFENRAKSKPDSRVPVPENAHNCFFTPVQCLFVADPSQHRL